MNWVKLSRDNAMLPLLFAVLIALPVIRPQSFFLSFLTLFFIYAALANSLDILVGYMGYYDFGRAFYFGLGAYVAAIALRDYKLSPFLSMPISLAVCFVVAFFILIGARRMRGVYFGILTMALVYLVQNLFSILPYTGGAEGILLQRLTASMDPHLAEIAYYESTLIYLILVVFATGFIVRSKLGKGIISIREDEDVAEMRGVNTVYVKAVSYGVSAALSGAAGNLYAYFAGYIDPSSAFGFVFSINVLLMVLLGGMGTRYGPLLGAFIFIMLSEVLRYSIPSTFEGLHVIIFGSLIVIFTVFAPSGLMGVLSRMMKKKRVAKSSAG